MNGILAVLLTHAASSLMERNNYGYDRNIKHANFCETIEQANQFFKMQYNKDTDETHPVPNKKARTE